MKTRARFKCSRTTGRGAFTLIELLVVITIIAALAALAASAVLKFIEVQQSNNTQSTLDRAQGELAKAWSKVKDDANKASMTELVPGGNGQTVKQWIQQNLAGADANATGRTRVLYIKFRLRQAFPMNFNEALNPYPLPPLQGYVSYLSNFNIPGSSGASYESSACLLMALSRGVSGAVVSAEELTKGGATGVGPGGIPYLTDAWGRPIFFTRVPAGSSLLNTNPYPGNNNPPPFPGGGQQGANDPGDPQGYLQLPNWGTTYGAKFSGLTLQVLASSNCSFKLAPMVASGGPYNWEKANVPPGFDPITFAPLVFVPKGGMAPQPLSQPYQSLPDGSSLYLAPVTEFGGLPSGDYLLGAPMYSTP